MLNHGTRPGGLMERDITQCSICGSRRFRIYASTFSPPNHRFKIWRLKCEKGHPQEPEGEMLVLSVKDEK